MQTAGADRQTRKQQQNEDNLELEREDAQRTNPHNSTLATHMTEEETHAFPASNEPGGIKERRQWGN